MNCVLKCSIGIAALAAIGIFGYYWSTRPKFSDDKVNVEKAWLGSIASAYEWYYEKNQKYPIGTLEDISVALNDRSTTGSRLYLDEQYFKDNVLVDGWGTPVRITSTNDFFIIQSAGRNKTWGDNDDHAYKEPLDKTYEHGPPSNVTDYYK